MIFIDEAYIDLLNEHTSIALAIMVLSLLPPRTIFLAFAEQPLLERFDSRLASKFTHCILRIPIKYESEICQIGLEMDYFVQEFIWRFSIIGL